MGVAESLGKQLSLISFASASATRELSRDLNSLGFLSDISDGDNWLRKPGPADHGSGGPLVCLIDKTTDAHSVSAPLLARLRGRRWLCASRADDQASIGSLLRASTEFVQSPWTQRELVLRLERLRGLTADGPPPAPAVRDFAALNIVGQAELFQSVLIAIRKAARFTAPVLICGETGTGKELAARAVHYLSERKSKPFVPVNCGAIPENLIENELFGHERGAFTDARNAQEGLASQANGGTLFLDEVEALSLKSQVTLLRFLQDLEVRPLGASRTRKVDVRILSATNAPIAKLVEGGQFRRDLYFRLNVVELEMPPLRDRRGDIEILVQHFLEKFTRTYGLLNPGLDRDASEWLCRHTWPGNVRELENVIHRGVIQADGGSIRLPHLLQAGQGSQAAAAGATRRQGFTTLQSAKRDVVTEFERRYLERLLIDTGGNVTLAAKRAGTERRALGKLLKKHGIDRTRFRQTTAGTPHPGRN